MNADHFVLSLHPVFNSPLPHSLFSLSLSLTLFHLRAKVVDYIYQVQWDGFSLCLVNRLSPLVTWFTHLLEREKKREERAESANWKFPRSLTKAVWQFASSSSLDESTCLTSRWTFISIDFSSHNTRISCIRVHHHEFDCHLSSISTEFSSHCFLCANEIHLKSSQLYASHTWNMSLYRSRYLSHKQQQHEGISWTRLVTVIMLFLFLFLHFLVFSLFISNVW